MTDKQILQRRTAQAKWYHANKSSENYKKLRRNKQKRHQQRHCFARLLKQLKKRDSLCTMTRFDLWRIAKRQKLICDLTGRPLTNENISPDHILHLSKGGKTTLENIRLVIREANMARQTLDDNELVKLCQDIVSFFSKKN